MRLGTHNKASIAIPHISGAWHGHHLSPPQGPASLGSAAITVVMAWVYSRCDFVLLKNTRIECANDFRQKQKPIPRVSAISLSSSLYRISRLWMRRKWSAPATPTFHTTFLSFVLSNLLPVNFVELVIVGGLGFRNMYYYSTYRHMYYNMYYALGLS